MTNSMKVWVACAIFAVTLSGLVLLALWAAPDSRTVSVPASHDVIDAPPDVADLTTWCWRGNRIYESPHGSIAVVASDPTCA